VSGCARIAAGRLRVGDYRVIYTIDNGELVVRVVHVGHRSTVYDT
jgi:mRNA interferase RelE/StbE